MSCHSSKAWPLIFPFPVCLLRLSQTPDSNPPASRAGPYFQLGKRYFPSHVSSTWHVPHRNSVPISSHGLSPGEFTSWNIRQQANSGAHLLRTAPPTGGYLNELKLRELGTLCPQSCPPRVQRSAATQAAGDGTAWCRPRKRLSGPQVGPRRKVFPGVGATAASGTC